MTRTWEGAIAIWNDITPEGRENFYEWHGREHIPERVGIPGFLGGRRYVARYGVPEYFTLYPVTHPEVFRREEYAARLNAPTDWTLRSTAAFRNVARALCAVQQSAGALAGGLMATWRLDADAEGFAARCEALTRAMPGLCQRPGVAGAHLLLTDMEASSVDNEERRRRGEPNAVPGCILLVEGWGDESAFATLCDMIGCEVFGAPDTPGVAHGLYGLQTLMISSAPAAQGAMS